MFYNHLTLNLLKQKLFSHSLTFCVSVSSSEEAALLSVGFLGLFSAVSCLLLTPVTTFHHSAGLPAPSDPFLQP